MSVPIIDVILIKNSDATWTVKLYHMSGVYTEATFSHVAFAEELANEYFTYMKNQMSRDKAVEFTASDYKYIPGEAVAVGGLHINVAKPGTYMGVDLGMDTDESVASLISVDAEGNHTILETESISDRPIPLAEKPPLGEVITPNDPISLATVEEGDYPTHVDEPQTSSVEDTEPPLQAFLDQVEAGVLPAEEPTTVEAPLDEELSESDGDDAPEVETPVDGVPTTKKRGGKKAKQ
jgi:hypothetical protein